MLHPFPDLNMLEVRGHAGDSLVFVYCVEVSSWQPRFHGLFFDRFRGRRVLGRAPVSDELALDKVVAQHVRFLPAVGQALRRAYNRERDSHCAYPFGPPELCWRSTHGPQRELPQLPELRHQA